MFSGLYITTKKVLAEDLGVKPKNIINPCQDADYNQAVLQAATNWQVQPSADKAITSVILVPSLLKSASNPLTFWSISMFLNLSSYSSHLKNVIFTTFWHFFFSLRMNAVWIQLKDNLKICQLLVSEKGNVSLQILNTGKKLKQNTIHLFIRDLSSSAFKLVVPIFPYFSPVSFYFSFVSFCFPMALYSILTLGQSEFRRH